MINDNDPWLILCRLSTPELINLSLPLQAQAHKLLTIPKPIPRFFFMISCQFFSFLAAPLIKGQFASAPKFQR